MWLDLWCKPRLWFQIELNHCFRKSFRVTTQSGDDLQNGGVESAIDLSQWELAWVVDHHQRSMTQESFSHWGTSCISWRVTGTNKLYAVQSDPCLVRSSPETILLHKLTQERDRTLCAVTIRSGQVDFIAENDQPTSNLVWRHHHTIQSLLVLAVLLKGLD